jgi:hypothetical protein
MDCLLDEIYKLKKFKRKHPNVHEFDDAPKKRKKHSSETMKEKMARLRAMRGKK